MKKLLLTALGVACLAQFAPASANERVTIDDLLLPAITCDLTNPGSCNDLDIGNWAVSVTDYSGSPSVDPTALDLGVLAVTCVSTCAGDPLTVSLSDVNFAGTFAPGAFYSILGLNEGVGSGTVTQTTYYGAANTFFGETGLISTLSLSSSGTASINGGSATVTGPFSLTMNEVFSAPTSATIFSVDGSVGAVPEPSTLALVAAALLAGAYFVRRRRVF